MTRLMNTVASSARIYDGDYWAHALFVSGKLADGFSSDADYHAETPAAAEALRREWCGSAGSVAAHLSPVDATMLAPYFRQAEAHPGLRAHPDDEFMTDDPWVFVDFWRRLGIAYPENETGFDSALRLGHGYNNRLPSGDFPV